MTEFKCDFYVRRALIVKHNKTDAHPFDTCRIAVTGGTRDPWAAAGCLAPECWPRMRALAFSYSPADNTPLSLRRRCSRISSRRCSALVCLRAPAASRMCAASGAMNGRNTRKVPRPPVHSSNLAAPCILTRLNVSEVLYTATDVANAHTPIKVPLTGSQLCCHHRIAERSILEAIPTARTANTEEKVIQRHEICRHRRGASTNRKSRTYSSTPVRERARTAR
jgi:hypothetical protein